MHPTKTPGPPPEASSEGAHHRDEPTPDPVVVRPHRMARRRVLLALTSVVVAAGLLLVGASAWQLLAPHDAPVTERRAVPEAPALPNAPAARPVSVEIPAIGFDAEVRAFAGNGAPSLVPPDADHVHWLEEYGLPGAGSENTVYVIGHTSADGRAVFDPLVDRAAQRSTVLPGDEIRIENEAGLVSYDVVAVERHDRRSLADIENVWKPVPGRLVLITCFFESQSDAVSDNLVIFARARD